MASQCKACCFLRPNKPQRLLLQQQLSIALTPASNITTLPVLLWVLSDTNRTTIRAIVKKEVERST
jgi:hypothetical protein